MKSIALRLIGHRFDTRFKWGEIGWHPRHWKLGLRYSPFGMFDHNTLIVSLLIITFYVHLPTEGVGDGCMRGNEPEFGFYTIDNSVVWRWGQLYKSWDWPFVSLTHWRTEVLSLDLKSVYTDPGRNENWETRQAVEKANSATHGYNYPLKNGTTQFRIATIHVERWTWRRKWAPFLKMVRVSINVHFSDEVGERSGSWKGGCTGCSYEMRKGETPLETLRRMERERKFD
jgi:hypothetical protein